MTGGSAVIRQRKDRDGLQVQVYAGRDPLTGRKRWVSRQVPGKGRTAMKRARQVEAELLAQVAAGQHRGSRTKTVAELIERWLEWRLGVRPISPTTVAAYRGYIDRSILPSLGQLQVGQLDAATLDTFYARLRRHGGKGGRPLAAGSVRQIHAILSGALTRAVVWGWISHNPARLASPPSLRAGRHPAAGRRGRRPPAPHGGGRGPRAGAVPAPGRGAGRPSGRAVRAALVRGRPGPRRGPNRRRRGPRPPQGPAGQADQTHAKRRVAVGAGTVELLRARRVAQAKDALACGTTLAADAYVFSHVPDGSAPIDPDGMTHRFQRLARRLGVRCRLHDLRHFMVTQLVAGGVDWRTVSGRAGHADGHMTLATYAHFQQAQDRQAAEFMDELLVAADRPSR
jgi:integrase